MQEKDFIEIVNDTVYNVTVALGQCIDELRKRYPDDFDLPELPSEKVIALGLDTRTPVGSAAVHLDTLCNKLEYLGVSLGLVTPEDIALA